MANPIVGAQQILNIYKNPNKVWQDYLARGIINKKWKTKEMFQTAVQKAMNSAALYRKLKAKDPKIKSVDLKHAIAYVTGKPYKEYEGIPLRYQRDIKEGVLSSGKGKVVAVALDERRYNERIPEKVRDWFKEGEASGRLSKGSLERYEKHITSGNTENAKLRRRLHELTCISWHKGHLRALAQLGSNDPLSQVSELGAENLSHNREDAIQFEDIEELGLPTDWWSSATEFVLAESPKAADFLKQYYISQEYRGGPIDITDNLDQYLKLDNLTPEVITGRTNLSTDIHILVKHLQSLLVVFVDLVE